MNSNDFKTSSDKGRRKILSGGCLLLTWSGVRTLIDVYFGCPSIPARSLCIEKLVYVIACSPSQQPPEEMLHVPVIKFFLDDFYLP